MTTFGIGPHGVNLSLWSTPTFQFFCNSYGFGVFIQELNDIGLEFSGNEQSVFWRHQDTDIYTKLKEGSSC